MAKLKSLLRLIDRTTTVSIKNRWKSKECDLDKDCEDCEHYEWMEGCNQPEHLHDKIQKTELFNGYVEDIPFKLMETTVIAVDAYIQKPGKNGRMKHGTRAVIEIWVKVYDDDD